MDFGNSDVMFGGGRTTVVNLKREPFDVYIGRAGKGQDGYFGNPVRRGRLCPICHGLHFTAASTLGCYKIYFERRIAHDVEFKARVEALRGLRLGCFCKPGPCHGDIIVEHLQNSVWDQIRKLRP